MPGEDRTDGANPGEPSDDDEGLRDEAVARIAPGYLERYRRLESHIASTGDLTEREVALLRVATAAAVTHFHRPDVEAAVRDAFDAGATEAEVSEVLQLVSGLGVHALIEGVPLLAAAADEPPDLADESIDGERVKANFERERGYWSDIWDDVLAFDPAFLELYTDLSAYPWREGTLSSKLRELVYIAIDASTTHLYIEGLRVHIENALDQGATPATVLAVLELVSLQGIASLREGATALIAADEMEEE